MGARVLVATDGSAFALAAARRGLAVLDPAADVTVVSVAQYPVSVVPVTGVAALPVESVDSEAIEHVRAHAREAADATVAALREPASAEVLEGEPGDAICRYATEGAFDVIVVGSHGSGIVKRLLVGSVSHYVLHHAPCPVLVVHPEVAEG